MSVFINGTGCLSPVESMTNQIPEYPARIAVQGFYRFLEPDYKTYISPVRLRRMSRIVKAGVYSAMKALEEAGIENPDAIITGTALGCLDDTEVFLNALIENKETLLNPGSFIQSTHNTLSGTIALLLKCNHYNFTYVHRGFSFEWALLDGLLLLREGRAKNVLTGAADEMTPNYFKATGRLGWWRKEPINGTPLHESHTKGAIAGEGTAFFLLSSQKQENSLACLADIQMVFRPENSEELQEVAYTFLQRNGLSPEDLSLVLTGINGDVISDEPYHYLGKGIFRKIPQALFKNLSGEYFTASSFAAWLGARLFNQPQLPKSCLIHGTMPPKPEHILIYNHWRGTNHSFILLSKC